MRNLLLSFSLLLFTLKVSAQAPQSASFTTADHVNIYYATYGTGYPVVLLHGFANTSANWLKTPTFDSLTKAGYRVIVPDLRGNGRSTTPPNEQGFANDAQVQDIADLMTSLHVKQYDVIGYSRGSIVAAKLLTLDPRVRRAVLGGMGDSFTDPNWDRPRQFYQVLNGDTAAVRKYNMQEFMNYINQSGFNKLSLAYQQKYQPVTTPAELNRLHLPVLVLRGSEDVDNGSAVMLQSMIPGARLKYVPGDHNHAYGTPEFAATVLAFMREME